MAEWHKLGPWFSYAGNSIELKYSFSSPYKDPIGIAPFVEPEYALADSPSGDKSLEWELEGVIFD